MWQVKVWLIIAGTVAGLVQAQQFADPTAPPQRGTASAAPVQTTDLRLTAIQQQASTMVAYINGKRVTEGAQLPPYIISKITMNHVVVRHADNGREFNLSLYAQSSFLSDSSTGAGGQNE